MVVGEKNTRRDDPTEREKVGRREAAIGPKPERILCR